MLIISRANIRSCFRNDVTALYGEGYISIRLISKKYSFRTY